MTGDEAEAVRRATQTVAYAGTVIRLAGAALYVPADRRGITDDEIGVTLAWISDLIAEGCGIIEGAYV